MIGYWAENIIVGCMKVGKPLNEVKICVKGITFRSGVKELYHSRNLALAKFLMEKGLDVYGYDELFTEEEILEIGLKFIEPAEADFVFDSFKLAMI